MYAKLDDTFHTHPKVVQLDLGAVGLWTLALSWTALHLTDGHIPARWALTQAQGDVSLIERLCEVGLWEEEQRNGGGYRIHDFHDYNLPAAAERQRRAHRRKLAQHAANERWRQEREARDA